MIFQLKTDKGTYVSVPLEQMIKTGEVLDMYAHLLLFLSRVDFGDDHLMKMYINECAEKYNELYSMINK